MGILDATSKPRRARFRELAAAALALASAGAPAGAQEPGPGDALANGRFTLELRPRYNRIDESDKPERTEAFTYRAIAGWVSAPWQGWRLTLQAIAADHVGSKRFNDDGSQIGSSPYPLLPDPHAVDVNQAFAEFTGIDGLRVRAGRQVVRMDNQRFVSDNNFRQIPQLFDGVSATYAVMENAELHAAWYGTRRTTSGESDRLGLTLLHAAWNPAPGHAVAAYAYFHDQAQNGAFTGYADNSYRIAGARAEGSFLLRQDAIAVPGGRLRIPYVAEFATQRAYSGGDPRIDVRYRRLGAGLATDAWGLRYDDEVKGSNRGLYGLQTPLTDFYAFNGWTLHFFNTPRVGLRDRWVTGRLRIGELTAFAEEHRFKGDFGGADYGRETDIGLTWPIFENAVLRLQNARYRPGAVQPLHPKVTKTWLTLDWTY